jgi:hypothetical protein
MARRLPTALLVATLVGLPGVAWARYPWERDPGPIAGRWQASCPGSRDFIIEVSVSGKRAVGRVAAVGVGEAARRGYVAREEILRLDADDYGDWVGQFRWRSVSGADRWEPIRLVATQELLNATMTIDDCFRNMGRAH